MAPERPPSPLCISVTVPAATPLGAPHQAADVDGASVSGAPDDELTSLSWLQDRNLLRGINLCNKTQITSETEQLNGDIKDEPMGPSPTSDYLEDSCVSEDNNTQNSSSDQSISFTIADNVNNNNINKNHNIIDDYRYEYRYKNGDYRTKEISYNYSPMKSVKQNSPIKQKHPSNVPYDPLVHTTNKPPYSFSCLIFMAIEDSSAKALPVKEIYAWIVAHFPYFKNAPTGWKNSVRHNLSLNKCFQKVEKAPNLGKGSLWMVDEKFRPNLLQALTRSPFHPCSTLDPATYRSPTKVALTKESPPQPHKSGARLPNPELFPFLSRRLAASEMHSETPITDSAPVRINWNTSSWSTTDRSTVIDSRNTQTWTAESLEDVNAATVMLALKHGPRMFIEGLGQTGGVPVITSSPSEDHTYSAGGTDGHEALRGDSATSGGSGGSGSPDAAYESDDSQSLQMSHSDMEEQRRIAEGADALLNLARICGRSTSPVYSQKHNIQTTRYPIYEQHADNTEPRTRFKPRLLQRRPKRRPSPSEVRTKQHYDYINNNNTGFPETKRLKYEWSQD